MLSVFCPLRPFLTLALMGFAATFSVATPVEFSFRVAHDPADNPFSRDIWAELESPDGAHLRLPAFHAEGEIWTVRARADLKGNYRFIGAEEVVQRLTSPLRVALRGKDRIRIRDADPLGVPLSIDRRTGRTFLDGSQHVYVPFGGNLPWIEGDSPAQVYAQNFARFAEHGLNWTRIWMCHWGQLNLDWLESSHGDQPALGTLSTLVARRWDAIIDAAENNRVRLQMVLQHHGQYSTVTNSNWAENPWNLDNGGFLTSPGDFFTDPLARQLTRDKLRYIVARWGYSSSIMAWELFNEVHWTNARRGDADAQAAVAAWHTEMARHIRRYDVYGHLITTSDDDLTHPLWTAMDYYQPHLYASNMILGVQSLSVDPTELDRPVFYGEVGDDHMADLTPAQRADGFAQPLLAWSGLFGTATQPAQLWYIDTIDQNDRWGELASVARFARASGLISRDYSRRTQPTVIGGDTVPWRITPGYVWERGANPEFHLAADGSEPTELMDFRRILTNASAVPAHPYPSRATFHFRAPAATQVRLEVARISNDGGSLRVTLDGNTLVNEVWPAAAVGRASPTDLSFPFRVGYGDHTLIIENPTGPEWVDLTALDLGLDVPALIAVAKQSRARTALWVRHRTNLLSPEADEDLIGTQATVQLEDHPAGTWQVTWWDPAAGRSTSSHELTHPGGTLRLDTPMILRHAAAWLERIE